MVNGDCVYKHILAQRRSSGNAAGSGIGARAHRGHQVVPGGSGTGENQTHVIGCTQRHSWAVASGSKCGHADTSSSMAASWRDESRNIATVV